MAISNRQPGLVFGTPSHGNEGSARPSRGRVCGQLGCTTILSTYNSSDLCWLHTQPSLRPPLASA